MERIEAHIFIAFLAYRLYATLARRLQACAEADGA
jgi:transposase